MKRQTLPGLLKTLLVPAMLQGIGLLSWSLTVVKQEEAHESAEVPAVPTEEAAD